MKTLFFLFISLPYLLLSGEPVRPPALKKGDTIAIIAPASSPEEDQEVVARGIKMLMSKGYKVKIAANLMTRYGYLAGTDFDRAKALMDAWKDPEVKAIWCWRGGFGTTRLLDRIDYKIIRDNPKILIGMSDITALHAAIIKETGLITFLGPNLNGVFGKDTRSDHHYNQEELWKMISAESTQRKGYLISHPKSFRIGNQAIATLSPGIAKGRLAGGTLSLVVSLVGTPWQIETEGRILVLEEVDEEPYRIDRMLGQLKLAGLLEKPAGVVLCSWRGCGGKKPEKSLTLDHVFREYFSHAPYPVMVGFPSGHVLEQATLPLNALAELDAGQRTLRIIEDPVSAP